MPALRRARSSSRRKGSGPSTAAGLPRRRTMPCVFAACTVEPGRRSRRAGQQLTVRRRAAAGPDGRPGGTRRRRSSRRARRQLTVRRRTLAKTADRAWRRSSSAAPAASRARRSRARRVNAHIRRQKRQSAERALAPLALRSQGWLRAARRGACGRGREKREGPGGPRRERPIGAPYSASRERGHLP